MTSYLMIGGHIFYVVPHLREVSKADGSNIGFQQSVQYIIVLLQSARYMKMDGPPVVMLSVMIYVLAFRTAEFSIFSPIYDFFPTLQTQRGVHILLFVSHIPFIFVQIW